MSLTQQQRMTWTRVMEAILAINVIIWLVNGHHRDALILATICYWGARLESQR